MDGGSFSAKALSVFLASNLDLIEDWVNDGGGVFINSALNEGGDIDMGFGGVTLVYDVPETYANLATISDLEHTALYGPLLPTSVEMSGAYFSHAIITGSGLKTIVINPENPDHVLLAEKEWGAGRIMFGGLVAHNFQSPTTPVENWRANLLFNMYNDYCTKEITVGGYANLQAEESLIQLMYPNPASEIVQFQLIPETTVEIFSISGEQILAPTLNLQSYDVSMIEAGIYLVVFTNESSRTTKRLIAR